MRNIFKTASSLFFLAALTAGLVIKPDISLRAQIYDETLLSGIEGRVVSMDFKDANIKDVLKVFSQQSGLNFIASESVQDRKVTLYLEKVPVREAMEKILNANNLTYVREEGSNIFVVKDWGKSEVETITRVYYLKYARVKNARMETEIKTEMKSATTTGTLASSLTGAGASGTSATETTQEEEVGITKVIEKLLSEKGKVAEDVRTNSVIVTDIPSRFPAIEATIARLDISTPLVMIETEMLDVSKRAVDQLGVNWPKTIAQLTVPGSKLVKFPFGSKGTTPSAYTIDPAAGQFGGPGAGWDFAAWPASHFGPSMFTVIGSTLALDFLKTQTDTKYLARPRIFTLSNETAEIRITTNEAIGLTTSVAGGGTGVTTSTQQAERSTTGVLLRVTPQVNLAANEITMFIEPSVAVANTGGTFGGTTFKDPETRGTKSTLRIRDGETIVIGGLLRRDQTDINTKVPFLSDIPIVRGLFKHKDNTVTTRELIVFLTPHIIKEQGAQSLAKAKDTDRGTSQEAFFEREQSGATSSRSRQEEIDYALNAYGQ